MSSLRENASVVTLSVPPRLGDGDGQNPLRLDINSNCSASPWSPAAKLIASDSVFLLGHGNLGLELTLPGDWFSSREWTNQTRSLQDLVYASFWLPSFFSHHNEFALLQKGGEWASKSPVLRLPDSENPDVFQQTLVTLLPRKLSLSKGDARGIFWGAKTRSSTLRQKKFLTTLLDDEEIGGWGDGRFLLVSYFCPDALVNNLCS